MLPELLQACSAILSDTPMFALITLYSIEASSIMAANVLDEHFGKIGNCRIEAGELALSPREGYALPLSLWARASF